MQAERVIAAPRPPASSRNDRPRRRLVMSSTSMFVREGGSRGEDDGPGEKSGTIGVEAAMGGQRQRETLGEHELSERVLVASVRRGAGLAGDVVQFLVG